jgi:hypothetical protein
MAGMPQTDSTQTPTAHDSSNHSFTIQEVFSGPEGQLVHGINRDIVPDIKNAGSFIAGQAIDVLRSVGFAAADGAIVNGMRPGIAGLERKTVVESSSWAKGASSVKLAQSRPLFGKFRI